MTKAQNAVSKLKSSSLRRFRLFAYGYGGYDDPQDRGAEFVKNLMTSPATCKVQELSLFLWPDDFGLRPHLHELPNSIFSSGNLCVLDLSDCEISNDIGTINLPSLETLSLCAVRAPHEVFSLFINSCSKSIKRLRMKSCYKISHLEFCLQELREMIVIYCSDLQKIALDAPKLRLVDFCHWGRFGKFSLEKSADLKIGVGSLNFVPNSTPPVVLESFKNMVFGLGLAENLDIHLKFPPSVPLPQVLSYSSSLIFSFFFPSLIGLRLINNN